MNIANWLSPETLRPLAWALLHFLWQGTALAALAAVLMSLCKRASARYALAVSVLVLMLAAPLATVFFFYTNGHEAEAHVGVADAAKWSPAAAMEWKETGGKWIATGAAKASSVASSSSDLMPWLVEAWLIGVALLSLRSAGGLLLLERQHRKESYALSSGVLATCQLVQRRLGVSRAVRYFQCQWLEAPSVMGWFRPVVLLPVTALSGLTEAQLETVIAHELAHIRRLDSFVNAFQIAVETLLFYHPAVWWLNKRIRAERENCCDDTAIALCGNAVDYARALVLMEEWRNPPALVLAANGGPLSARIRRLLGMNASGSARRGMGVSGGVVCLTAALVAGNALVGMAHPRPQQNLAAMVQSPMGFVRDIVLQPSKVLQPVRSAQPTTAQPAQPTSRAVPTPSPMPAPVATPAPVPTPSPAVTVVATSAAVPVPAPQATPTPQAEPAEKPVPATSYIEAMKAAGIGDLDIDELLALKVQGVTPDYIRLMRAEGLHFDADDLIAMRVQGVTPEYIHELKGLGFTPDAQELIALKVQGVNGDYIRSMKQAGIPADIDQLIALKVQGVTPEYIHDMGAIGIKVDAENVIALRVQNVTPAYIKGMRDLGLQPDADTLIALRVQGVTPDYIRDINSLGFKPTADEFIAMRVQNVTPDFVKALQAAGFKVDVNEIIAARVQDITPEFINGAIKHGFKNLNIDKLIQLKNSGVLDSKGDI
jgi:beta-lactamase regulating signal transducer with metallopeptidase domain